MRVPMAALTDFNHYQGRICKHVQRLTFFAIYHVLHRLKTPSCPKVMGDFVKTIRSLMNYRRNWLLSACAYNNG